MRLRAVPATPASIEADVLAVPIYREDAELTGDLAELDAASGGAIRAAIDWGEFNPLEHAAALVDGGDLPAGRLLLLNGGARGRGAWRARRLAAVATRRLNGRGATTLALWLRDGESPRRLGGRRRRRARRDLPLDRGLRARARHRGDVPLGRRGARARCGAGCPGRGPRHRRGRRLRARPFEPLGQRPLPGDDGRRRARAVLRRLHGRGSRAGRHGTARDGDAPRRRAGRDPHAAADRGQAARLGGAVATGVWRSSARASASTRAASASSRPTAWAT